jgi:Na+/glutamate symporter
MDQASSGIGFLGVLIYIALVVFYIIAGWKIFVKAGKPGWACLIPIYNIIVMLDIVKRPIWWLILFFIPFVNIIITIILSIDMAKAFGKSAAFGFFMLFILGFIGSPMLAFGSATYTAPSRQ